MAIGIDPITIQNYLDTVLGVAFSLLIGFFVLQGAIAAIKLSTAFDKSTDEYKKSMETLKYGIMGIVIALSAVVILYTISAVTDIKIAPRDITSNLAQSIIDLLNCLVDPENKCQ